MSRIVMNPCRRIPLYALSFIALIVASCTGQVRSDAPATGDAHAPGDSIAPPTRHTKLVKTQGMGPGANVRTGLEDRAGNLWFGTTGEGVYRYDGESFINYTVEDGLSHNHVWCIYQDSAGVLWFGTADGITRYDGRRFTRVSIDEITGGGIALATPSKPPVADRYGNPSEESAVWSIMQDRKGMYWLGTTRGVYRYDGSRYSRFDRGSGIMSADTVPINKVESIVEDSSGSIWFGGRTTKGVFRFDGALLRNLQPDGEHWLMPRMTDRDGNVWFAIRSHRAYRYDGTEFAPIEALDGSDVRDWVTSMAQDTAGNLWFATDTGLWLYDGATARTFTADDGLANSSVFGLLADRKGRLWIGARGVTLTSYDGARFTNHTATE